MHRVTSIYSKHLNQGTHHRHFVVELDPGAGWRVRDEGDARLRLHTYDDWHRVELAISRFAIEAAQLRTEGWQEV